MRREKGRRGRGRDLEKRERSEGGREAGGSGTSSFPFVRLHFSCLLGVCVFFDKEVAP